MILEILLFVLGLVFLVEGSDFLVRSASSIAKRLGVSEFIIGLTLVALGTSVPELASAIAASLIKDSGLIIGNVIGSNIANIGLVIGLTASFYIIRTKQTMIKRDGYIMIFAAILFYLFILDGSVSWVDGLILLFFYFIYMMFLFERKKPKDHFRQFIRYFYDFKYLATIRSRVLYVNEEKKIKQKGKVKKIFGRELAKDFLILAVSGVVVVLGANYLVKEAVFFAHYFNVPSNIIGISLIAIGTSLPELIVSITAARKGFGEIAVGNIIGSNIANIFFVVGVSSLIHQVEIIRSTLIYTAPFMIFMCILLLFFLRSGWQIKRWEGMILAFLYVLLIVLLVTGVIY